MSSHSGMTLVEVLASLTLLALITGAAVPMLRSSFRSLRVAPARTELSELAEQADAFVADPAAFGFRGALPEEGVLVRTDEPGRELTRFRILTSNNADAEHAWIAIEVRGVTVFRWLDGAPL